MLEYSDVAFHPGCTLHFTELRFLQSERIFYLWRRAVRFVPLAIVSRMG